MPTRLKLQPEPHVPKYTQWVCPQVSLLSSPHTLPGNGGNGGTAQHHRQPWTVQALAAGVAHVGPSGAAHCRIVCCILLAGWLQEAEGAAGPVHAIGIRAAISIKPQRSATRVAGTRSIGLWQHNRWSKREPVLQSEGYVRWSGMLGCNHWHETRHK